MVLLASGEFNEPGVTEGAAPSEVTRIVPGLTESRSIRLRRGAFSL